MTWDSPYEGCQREDSGPVTRHIVVVDREFNGGLGDPVDQSWDGGDGVRKSQTRSGNETITEMWSEMCRIVLR
jgi:hypothetical protein